jgi:hypothetical protein
MNSHLWLMLLTPASAVGIAALLYYWTTRHPRTDVVTTPEDEPRR